jgi:hypothetical protein
MRRTNSSKRGRAFPVLPVVAAGLVGYLLGGWQPAALRAAGDPSAAAAVAQRFPEGWDTGAAPAPDSASAALPVPSSAASPETPAAPPQATATDDPLPESGVLADHQASAAPAASAPALSDAELVLLDPTPMVPAPRPQLQAARDVPPPVQLASAEVAVPASARETIPARRLAPLALTPERAPHLARTPAPALERRPMNRPGYMFDDAQIASIRQRLHLTPQQEEMWPAVAAALRNIAYTRGQATRGRGGEVDPDSVESLKSAAVPLIMSFNEDQKQQVRDLAHVMGLDQLASQF